MAGRVWHVSLDLLDRQLRDRDGVECGKVDDLELTRDDDGALWVSAILAGPGVLAYRLGTTTSRVPGSSGPTGSPAPPRRRARTARRTARASRSSWRRTSRRTSTSPSTGADLATHAGERWVGDHVIGHIPGHDHDTSDDDAADQ